MQKSVVNMTLINYWSKPDGGHFSNQGVSCTQWVLVGNPLLLHRVACNIHYQIK